MDGTYELLLDISSLLYICTGGLLEFLHHDSLILLFRRRFLRRFLYFLLLLNILLFLELFIIVILILFLLI